MQTEGWQVLVEGRVVAIDVFGQSSGMVISTALLMKIEGIVCGHLLIPGDFNFGRQEFAKLMQMYHRRLRVVAADAATFTAPEGESSLDFFIVMGCVANLVGAGLTIDLSVGLNRIRL